MNELSSKLVYPFLTNGRYLFRTGKITMQLLDALAECWLQRAVPLRQCEPHLHTPL